MMQQISGDTPIFQLSVSQLLDLLSMQMKEASRPIQEVNELQYVYGLSGLALLLNCSLPTAQKIKNSGKIPFKQVGRKLVFVESEVLKALDHKPSKRR